MDETYIKVNGVWKYLYRSVDKQGKTVDFLLTAKRDMTTAKRFFSKAMGTNGEPDKVAMDKSGANKAAIDAINAGRDKPILVRRVKYLNNIVEQDHRAIKRVTRPAIVNVVVASLQAASSNNAGSARSGLSQTSFFNCQLRVAPDQRSGQRCLAAS
jgi:transposase-like protein